MNHDHGQGMGKHMLMMLICCLVPIGLVLAVSTFGLSLGPLQPLVPYVAALMCPLMMGVMMYGMMRGNGGEHSHHSSTALPKTNTLAPSNPPLAQETQGTVQATPMAGREKCH